MPKQTGTNVRNGQWDYSLQAEYYKFRPNYADAAIDELCSYVGAKRNDFDYIVADIGAGTGNLTHMLRDRSLNCIAIEPNEQMRVIGKKRIPDENFLEWRIGTGENTGLLDTSIDFFVMGSSFNTTDRLRTLEEAHRVLKSKGFFSCLWNNRDIENDLVQKNIESFIREEIPEYSAGVRREGQADFILSSGLFNDIHYIQQKKEVIRSFEEYIGAWASVKNSYWDLSTEEGRVFFDRIINKITKEYGSDYKFTLTYITRIWVAKKF